MSATGNFNIAAKRTALGDRNGAPRDASDAPYAGKPGTTRSYNTTSTMVASKAQENRIQSNPKPKDALNRPFFLPAQRPPKTLALSTSMSQLRARTNDTYVPRKGLSKLNPVVYKDPQKEESRPAPVETAEVVTEDWPATQASKVQPAIANSKIKQQPPVDQASLERQSLQPEHHKLPDKQQPSRYTHSDAAQLQKRSYSSAKLPLLIPPADVPPRNSPRTDDDATEPLYVDAVEGLSEQFEFPTNELAQFIDAPQPHEPAARSHPEPHVPEPINPVPTSSAQPETNLINYNSDPYPPSFVNDRVYPSYLSDCDDEDDHYYDDKGYTTAHSYRSHGDNTTGGVTTVMLPPKITKKGQVEIEAAKQIVASRRTAEEIQEDAWDISMVAEYGDDIFRYMKELETTLLPNAHYMDNQGEIQWSMRSVLMDWVVQVHARFGLLPETLFLTVNYIDRFLSNKVVSLAKLQLVGATAIFIAAKYEEINCPSVQEIVYMVDGGYTVEEILKAERFMLSMLDFELGWPGPMSFLRRISKADDYDLATRTLAKYFLEVVIMDERFVASPPSYIAAGAHCLSRLILHKGEWAPAHVHYSGYTYQQLKPLVAMLLDCCRHARKHHSAVFDKYSDKRYRHASTYVEEEIMRGYTLPFEQRVSMSIVEYLNSEPPRASYAGSHADPHAGPHAIKVPISTLG
ncbi:cyclin-like protein [Xylaria sp. FL1777]|nr:cyclin-like protein [Xylaria sp. FL1777]